MLERKFILSSHTLTVKHKGKIKLFMVEEILPDGTHKTIMTKTYLGTADIPKDLLKVFDLITRNPNQRKGRAA
ncbi:hypothetical protein [Massiliimalia massiliensis]|uniref:hypothetical protein n=1 Tax=Massiliimalia massiliensis TaxID=1852384 RepID=UPI000984B5EC|nr:hypothetical protein [Massiliimalia massiliensis]